MIPYGLKRRLSSAAVLLDRYAMIKGVVSPNSHRDDAMKRVFAALLLCAMILCGCSPAPKADIAATTLPVWQFTTILCEGTGLTVGRLVTESVSCLHDYTLTVNQMRTIEGAPVLVLSGAGLEEFLEPALEHCGTIIDASTGLELLPGEEEFDPHIWLSPENAMAMAENICEGLCALYPAQAETIRGNLPGLLTRLEQLNASGKEALENLSCRDLITFHDGFSYFAQAFDLQILAAVEEESGSEASAAELKELITLTRENSLPAIFTETNGSDSAAQVISDAAGVPILSLDMAMAGDDYFASMEHNINTVKEALQ